MLAIPLADPTAREHVSKFAEREVRPMSQIDGERKANHEIGGDNK